MNIKNKEAFYINLYIQNLIYCAYQKSMRNLLIIFAMFRHFIAKFEH
jgi:hypothetical protein